MPPLMALFAGFLLGCGATYCLTRWLTDRRRTRVDVKRGFDAGVRAGNLPRVIKICSCGHPIQEHVKDIGCLGAYDIHILDKPNRHISCTCRTFTYWYSDGEDQKLELT